MDKHIRPAPLKIRLEPRIAASKLEQLLEDMKDRGGVETYLDALRSKHQVFTAALPDQRPAALRADISGVLLECVFPARRKLTGPMQNLSPEAFSEAILGLVYGRGDLLSRMRAFCERIPTQTRKESGAAWDLAAELLHFRYPDAVPLMTRWVWDTQTMSGAVREFVAGNEGMNVLPLEASPEHLEGVRSWFVEHLTASGFYRDLPFVTDLILARAYSDYVRSISGGLGILQGEFGAKQDPMELVVKLLGIDARRGERHAAASQTWH
ncbi:hypothetical protein [Ectothiorhodospira sp. BSL-9]|uniref:hypothetical protein n=1 Tax=Ectothiorhodospira sp. BSL-9 TaxID=1442136 RepID=UPI0007B429F4|nr:hypothetical protein [Ectothiorhodospira sp. BSL-9]ANB01222.1 hypothetical protein ECTOBSL9_0284 [Ectothiorhodospira sp. BSL-9]TVQ69906.1 MAG: hypothetical protein EA372_11265 [Chromatiaceae bacterium]